MLKIIFNKINFFSLIRKKIFGILQVENIEKTDNSKIIIN